MHLASVPVAMKSEQNSRAVGAGRGAGSLIAPQGPGPYDRDSGINEDLVDLVAVVVAIALVTMIALAC
jgi:hypothetical protein